MKTKLSVSIAAAAVGALLLVGCSSANPDASPSASVSGPLASVEWTEDDNGIPTVSFEKPFSVDASSALLVQDGDGAALEDGQIVSLAYTITNGDDGEVVYSTYDNGTPESVLLSADQMDPVLMDILIGAHVGADFLYSVVDTSTDPASTVVMAVTVVGATTPLDRAEGTAVEPVEGLPVVTLDAATGEPTVEIPKTDPPTELVAQPTIKGDGAVVEEGDSVTVAYTGWLWDGTVFDSSWEKGAPTTFALTKGQLIDGWVVGLAGQTVGSQVLLVIPPELGYGADGSQDGSIPADSTLVFVVDILAAS
ncbi:MAG: FKBP-type peptidyl-prolyl cis-trans isomerase [Actinomycetota bacterium]